MLSLLCEIMFGYIVIVLHLVKHSLIKRQLLHFFVCSQDNWDDEEEEDEKKTEVKKPGIY